MLGSLGNSSSHLFKIVSMTNSKCYDFNCRSGRPGFFDCDMEELAGRNFPCLDDYPRDVRIHFYISL